MTRPRGTVPVRLAQHRATRLARWLKAYGPPEKTLIATAGWTTAEVAADRAAAQAALAALVRMLVAKRTGRPRKGVSVYYLPVDGLRLLDRGDVALRLPARMRLTLRKALRATRIKKGPKLPPSVRARNLANGFYSPETVRKYRAADRNRKAKAAKEAARLAQIKSSKPALDRSALTLMAVMVTKEWLV